jgi:hypothetical protein
MEGEIASLAWSRHRHLRPVQVYGGESTRLPFGGVSTGSTYQLRATLDQRLARNDMRGWSRNGWTRQSSPAQGGWEWEMPSGSRLSRAVQPSGECPEAVMKTKVSGSQSENRKFFHPPTSLKNTLNPASNQLESCRHRMPIITPKAAPAAISEA